MEVTLKIFGQLAEIIGSDQLSVSGMENTDQLITQLKKLHPDLKKINFTIAVDKKIVSENTGLSVNSIVALLPPFSGG
jgi:sulfur-carrier protein